MGTDNLGRDNLSRIIFGTRVSIQAGVVAVGIAAIIGTLLGIAAGYWRGWIDDVLMRLCDALWSFPGIVLALFIAAALGPGLVNAMIAIGIVFIPVIARLVRARRCRSASASSCWRRRCSAPPTSDHAGARAAERAGAGDRPGIAAGRLRDHRRGDPELPGLGVQPPEPSWGSMLKAAAQYMQVAPWLSFFPGVAIFVTVLGLNLLGDGLRRALDPRLRGRGEA